MEIPKPTIEMRPVSDLHPYAKNARTHSKDQIAQVAASITEFGWTNPVLVDKDGTIIAGHARIEAAKTLRIAEVPTIALEHLTPLQLRAYILADNQLALNAGWDDDVLRDELAALDGEDYDLTMTGFESSEVDRLLRDAANNDERDDEEEDQELSDGPAITQPGDIWLLGKHRLICGDSFNKAVVDRVLDGAQPFGELIDPPFEFDYSGIAVPDSVKVIQVWGMSHNLLCFLPSLLTSGWGIFWYYFSGVVRGHRQLNFPILTTESVGMLRRGGGYSLDAPILQAEGYRMGDEDRRPFAHQEGFLKPHSKENHVQAKTVQCLASLIASTKKGDAIFDPFCGSGASIIAAEKYGRSVVGIEKEPKWCDFICSRWAKYTGGVPVRQEG